MRTKIHFCIAFALLTLSIKPCLAQKNHEQPPLDSTKKDFRYEEVVQVKDNANKSALYKRAKATIIGLFGSQANIIQNEDTAQGFMITKVSSDVQTKGLFETDIRDAKVLFNLTIQVKDGKYRYVIDNINLKYTYLIYHTEKDKDPKKGVTGVTTTSSLEEGSLFKKGSKKFKEEANTSIEGKIASLKTAMETGNSGNLKKDW